jgi:predicted dehydrogenase
MVQSVGGRYFGDDDWETPDTQVINIEFGNKFSMTWEGRSCNGMPVEGHSVGCMFYGDKGSLFLTGNDEYKHFGPDSKLITQQNTRQLIDPLNPANPSNNLDAIHINNFLDAIRKGEPLRSDIDSGHKSTLLVQLGNIAQRVGRNLKIDEKNGRILNDPEAMKLWSRDFEPGWEMKI